MPSIDKLYGGYPCTSESQYPSPSKPRNGMRGSLDVIHDHESPVTIPRPGTPLPDDTRTLRRAVSCASIDTICSSNPKGIRQRITEITDALKNKSTMKRKRKPSAHNDPQHKADNDESNAKAKDSSKSERKVIAPLRDASQRLQVVNVADSLHIGVSSGKSTPLTSLVHVPDLQVNEPPPKEGSQPRENNSFPNWNPKPQKQAITNDQATFESPPKIGISDLEFTIRQPESHITMWDGLGTSHHLFKCRLFLRCVSYPFDSVCIPNTERIELQCRTYPISGPHYIRSPAIQTTYQGASIGCLKTANGIPNVDPAAGIYMDQFWRTRQENDGRWGWYRDAYVPLSSRLFDKMEYRQFKLVGRLWFGEKCVENESTFGISMLLREVEMN